MCYGLEGMQIMRFGLDGMQIMRFSYDEDVNYAFWFRTNIN
jgi:hypothetical protein